MVALPLFLSGQWPLGALGRLGCQEPAPIGGFPVASREWSVGTRVVPESSARSVRGFPLIRSESMSAQREARLRNFTQCLDPLPRIR